MVFPSFVQAAKSRSAAQENKDFCILYDLISGNYLTSLQRYA